MVQGGLFQLALWLVLVSPFELTISLFFICGMIEALTTETWVIRAVSANLTYFSDGRIEYDDMQGELAQLHTNMSQWLLVLKMTDGAVRLLWRDSCDDASYRQLIIHERQRQIASV